MNKLVAVVGMAGSGKSVATDYLESRGWNKIYFGGVVLEEVQKRGMDITPENERLVREELREKYGMGAMAEILLPRIRENIQTKDTVLDGLYSWDEYVILKREFRERLKLICVITDRSIRYSRVGLRKVRPLNKEEIEKRDITEIENLAKGGPIAIADYYLFNNGDLSQYENRLEEILDAIEKEEVTQ